MTQYRGTYISSGTNIHLPKLYAIVLGVLYSSGLVLPWLLPSLITQAFKPFAIFICLLILLIWKVKLRIGFIQIIAIYSVIYYTAILIGHGITGASLIEYVSTTLYMLMFLFSTIIYFNAKSVKLIMNSVFIASLTFAIIVAVSNPIIGTTGRTSLGFLYTTVNGNLIPYAILPGLVIGIQALLFGNKYKNFWTLVAIFIMSYSLFMPATRGAFLCLLAVVILSIYRILIQLMKKRRFTSIFGLGIVLIGIVIITIQYLPDSISMRLFDFRSYTDTSSRTEIYNASWNLAQENLWFGNGFDALSSLNIGHTHNTYLEVLVYTGIIGVGMLITIIVSLLLKMRQSLLYAFLAISVVESMVETGGAYTFWIPIIIATILSDHCKKENYKVEQFYHDNF